MKKVIALLVSLFVIINVEAEYCLYEGITFTTQEQIDNFQTNYPGCTEIGGDLIIGSWQYTGNITNLNGLSVITYVGHDLIIRNNLNLDSLMGLNNIIEVGENMRIAKNPGLTNLIGLGNLTTIVGNLTIEFNSNLTSMTGMDSLNEVWGDLIINSNINLSSIDGFENLNMIYYGLKITSNNLLSTLNGFDNLNSIEYILIEANNSLINLDGFDNLNAADYIWIEDNNSLINLNGLESVTTLITGLSINNNNALNNINGLAGLSSIGGGLGIYDNPSLNSLSGLENISNSSINTVWIYNNDLLSDCNIQFICDLLDDYSVGWDIHDNASGCNDLFELEAACITSIEEVKTGNEITIIPNPSNDIITISSTAITGNTKLSIFTISGEKVLERQLIDNETQLDISALPRGIYFVKVQNDKIMEVGKIIKE